MKLATGAKTVLMLAGLVVVIAGLRSAGEVLVPLLAAAFVTVVSMPVVRWLTARRVPHPVALGLTTLLIVGVFAGIGGLIGGSVNDFYSQVPKYQSRLTDIAQDAGRWIEHHGARVDIERIGQMSEALKPMDLVAQLLQSIFSLVGKAFLVGLLVLFMLFETRPWRMKMGFLVKRPAEMLPRFDIAAREVQTYLFVKSGLSLLTGVLCASWVAICGVDFPLLWGLLAFLLNYIPTIGMFVATVPPILLALITLGPGSAILLLTGYIVINVVLGNFVEPRIMGRALGLSPLVVFLSMVFWGWLWGPVGAVLGVPLTMVLKILLANTEDLRWAAVLLGSEQWLAERRKEWGDPIEEDLRRSHPPPPPVAPIVGLDLEEVGGSGPRRLQADVDESQDDAEASG